MRLLIRLLPLVTLLAMPTAGSATADRITFATACAPGVAAPPPAIPGLRHVVASWPAQVMRQPVGLRHGVPDADAPLLFGALLMLAGALMWRWGERHGR